MSIQNERSDEKNSSDEIPHLVARVAELEAKLAGIARRRKAARSALLGSSSWLVRFFAGSELRTAGQRFSESLASWQAGARSHAPLGEASEVAVAVFSRFVRVGIITLFLALIPSFLLILQAWLLSNQNYKFDVQNDLLGKDIALTAFEQTSRFRSQLWLEPRELKNLAKSYPDVYNEGEKTLWPEPRRSSVIQIAMLAESQPDLVFRSLIPLLSDPDSVVSAGALLALRDILLSQPPNVVTRLRSILPRGQEQAINLRNVHIAEEDLTAFAGTDLFYNARLESSVLEEVIFDGLNLEGSEFARSAVLHCSFVGATLKRSRWHDAAVRATSFAESNLVAVFAQEADFGTASAERTTKFIPVNFSEAVMTDMILNRASLVDARFHRAHMSSTQVAGADFTGAYMDVSGQQTWVTEATLREAGAMFTEEAKYGR